MTPRPTKQKKFMVMMAATAVALSLAACQTTNTAGQNRADRIDAALERANGEAATPAESLAMLERAYKRDSDDPDTAIKYGRALREAGRSQRSAVVLAPFADDGKRFPAAKVEYAATQAALGNYESAEKYASAALAAQPDSGQANHILGIALDAQGKHQQSEAALRKALENWEGNPAPVLNNLGLNLASQGYIDEALETLRRALETAPNRTEIERNLRIVTALQPRAHTGTAEGYHYAPKPARKPGNS
jgi:Flp pilus assembly protein TadD